MGKLNELGFIIFCLVQCVQSASHIPPIRHYPNINYDHHNDHHNHHHNHHHHDSWNDMTTVKPDTPGIPNNPDASVIPEPPIVPNPPVEPNPPVVEPDSNPTLPDETPKPSCSIPFEGFEGGLWTLGSNTEGKPILIAVTTP